MAQRHSRVLGAGLFVSVILALIPSPGVAQTTWTGAVSADWGVAGNWSAGVPTASVDAVVPTGAPNQPSTAGVAGATCRDLALNAGATLTIAPSFPLAAARSVTFSGNITGGGLLRFVGNFAANAGGAGAIGASIEIAKTLSGSVGVTSSWSVTGDLTHTSGAFLVAQNVSYVVNVSGNAAFQGGTLGVFATGTIEVAGDVTFSGTTVTGAVPTIRCGGNWTANSSFAPAGGLAVMSGTGAQSIAGAGSFWTLTINASSVTTSPVPLTIGGTLTVNGTLSMPAATLDVNGSFTVGATGSVDLGAGTHTFAQNYTVNGNVTASGTLVFDSAAFTTAASVVPFPNVVIAKGSTSGVTVGSAWTVTGNLVQTSGGFNVASAAAFVVSVLGNATFQGGTLGVAAIGTIDVAGDVTFSGTSATGNTPTIRCAGNWSANASYAPAGGLVVMSGTGAQSIAGAGLFATLTIDGTSVTTSPVSLTVAGPLTVNGTLSMPAATLDANGSFTVGATGSVDLGAGTHTFAQNYTVNGNVTASGTLVFDSAAFTTAASVVPFPNVVIAKGSTSGVTVGSAWTVTGNLVQTSGGFNVASAAAFVVSVLGNATFQGGTLGVAAIGTIDVAGDVTFSGTSATGNTPTIRCAGNWSANASYAPAGGLVVMSGTGAQSIAGAGLFATLTIDGTSVTTSPVSLTVAGPLTVNGTLSMPAATLDANGSFTVGATGSVDLGAGTHTFAQNYTVNGNVTASGTLVFDSAAFTTAASVVPFPNVVIAKGSTSGVTVGSAWTVTGNLVHTSGGFNVASAAPFVVSVLGNATFQGGTLAVAVIGTIDVAGDVTFSGTSATGIVPTIRCAGNWSSDGGFAPTAGIVELDGTAASTFTSTTGSWLVPTLRIKNGTRAPSSGLAIAATTITIESGGSLDLAAFNALTIHRPSGSTALNVEGALHVATGAEVALGPQTTATVSATGLLELIGTVDFPARVAGAAGGAYGLTINGAISAMNFVVKEMGTAGVVINTSATFASPPNDFRGGRFDFRSGAPAGSVLLDVRRAVAADIRYAEFLNTPGVSGVFNARTVASSAPVAFTNWTGVFAGPAFESDPNNLIAWNPPQQTALTFSAQPGAELSEITWTVSTFVDYAGFSLRRATNPGGPFVELRTSTAVSSFYACVDMPLVPNLTHYYELHEQLTHGAWVLVATGTTIPYSSAPPPNVYKVGGGGPFVTIQAAVAAATHPDSVVWVTPGTYAPFTVGAAAPSNLRILGDGTGPVDVDTTSGPVQIAGVPATSGIEIGHLTIGSAATAQSAIVISNCACVVVLDELVVRSDATHAAVSVSASPGVAIQGCDAAGGPGVSASGSSFVAISRGLLDSLVSTASTIETTGIVPGSVNVTPPGSLIAHPGVMLAVDVPEYPRLSSPLTFTFDGFPSSSFTLVVATRLGFLSVPGVVEMPVLFDFAGATLLPPLPTSPSGHFEVTFEFPPVAASLGTTYIIQAAMVNPGNGQFRVSNVASMVLMP